MQNVIWIISPLHPLVISFYHFTTDFINELLPQYREFSTETQKLTELGFVLGRRLSLLPFQSLAAVR